MQPILIAETNNSINKLDFNTDKLKKTFADTFRDNASLGMNSQVNTIRACHVFRSALCDMAFQMNKIKQGDKDNHSALVFAVVVEMNEYETFSLVEEMFSKSFYENLMSEFY
jgi:hypothetical protein